MLAAWPGWCVCECECACVCVSAFVCLLIASLSLIRNDQYASIPFAFSRGALIKSGRGAAALTDDWLTDASRLPLFSDDEVRLGQLQTLRLGQERAAAPDEERTHRQHVR